MGYLKKIPLFLFLLPVFFCLHGSVENFGYVTASGVTKLCLVILIVITLLFFSIRFFAKSTLFAALVTFYIGVWNLFFGALHDWLRSTHLLFWLSRYTVLLPLLFISTVIWIIVLKRRKHFQNKLLYYFNILLIIYCVYDISLLLIKSFSRDKDVTGKHVVFDYSLVKTKPNVYYLLFDEYPGYKSLADRFGFANDSLYSFLSNNGFEILPSVTNYNFTYFSLASVFNMDYLPNVPHPQAITEKDYLQQMKEIKKAEVFSIFTSMGYSIKNLSIFNIQDKHSFANNETVPSDIELFTHKILYRKFFKDVGWKFVVGKYQVPFLKKIFFSKDDFNRKIEEKLLENIHTKTADPKFLYAHFFLPHQPIYFDSAGNYLPEEIILNSNTVLNKNYFLGYIKYTNSKIVFLTNEIIKNDPGAVIVIMSDHGYGLYNDTSLLPYYFDNICAVRTGDTSCINPAKVSGVNFFRYLFNCRYDQKLPYLKDTSIFLTDYVPVR